MATLCQQQDGGSMLLCKRYVNNKMACVTMERLFYIFNSTVVDWTCYFCRHCSFTIGFYCKFPGRGVGVRVAAFRSYCSVLNGRRLQWLVRGPWFRSSPCSSLMQSYHSLQHDTCQISSQNFAALVDYCVVWCCPVVMYCRCGTVTLAVLILHKCISFIL